MLKYSGSKWSRELAELESMGRLSRCPPLGVQRNRMIRRIARSTQGMGVRPSNPDAQCVPSLLGCAADGPWLDRHDLQ